MTDARSRRVKDCDDPWTGVAISASGDVAPCCHADQRMGNVGEEELDDVWAGPRFRTFRAFLKSPTPLPACETCFVRGWKTEPLPPRGGLRETVSRLLRTAGVGGAAPRLRVWADREVHRPGELLSFSVALEAGSLLDGGRLDLHLVAEDPAGTRHFVSFAGRALTVSTRPAPLLGGIEPLDIEWLELRGTPPRDWPPGEWRVTAALTAAGPGPDEEAPSLAAASCTFTEAI